MKIWMVLILSLALASPLSVGDCAKAFEDKDSVESASKSTIQKPLSKPVTSVPVLSLPLGMAITKLEAVSSQWRSDARDLYLAHTRIQKLRERSPLEVRLLVYEATAFFIDTFPRSQLINKHSLEMLNNLINKVKEKSQGDWSGVGVTPFAHQISRYDITEKTDFSIIYKVLNEDLDHGFFTMEGMLMLENFAKHERSAFLATFYDFIEIQFDMLTQLLEKYNYRSTALHADLIKASYELQANKYQKNQSVTAIALFFIERVREIIDRYPGVFEEAVLELQEPTQLLNQNKDIERQFQLGLTYYYGRPVDYALTEYFDSINKKVAESSDSNVPIDMVPLFVHKKIPEYADASKAKAIFEEITKQAPEHIGARAILHALSTIN